jgi:hypothetical protein
VTVPCPLTLTIVDVGFGYLETGTASRRFLGCGMSSSGNDTTDRVSCVLDDGVEDALLAIELKML